MRATAAFAPLAAVLALAACGLSLGGRAPSPSPVPDEDASSASDGAPEESGTEGAPAGDACTDGCAREACPPPGAADVARASDEEDRCLVYVRTRRTFDAAARACGALGRGWTLASLRDGAELDRARALVDDDAWIGLRDREDDDVARFEWLDGSPSGFAAAPLWGPGEPNDGDGEEDGDEDCAGLYRGHGYALDDSACDAERGYLCASPRRPR